MTMRICPKPGCPTPIPKGRRFCDEHAAEEEKRRGSPAERGYDAAHVAERKRWAAVLAFRPVLCAKGCGQYVTADMNWHLGHTDDRKGWTGPEHQVCNTRDAGLRGGRHRG